MSFVEGPVYVRTPATSANLGPGFDALGLALGLYDDITAEVTAEPGVRVEVRGEGADDVPRDHTHLVARALLAALDEVDVDQPGVRLRCVNRIPHGRGLGSSAAAIVGGVLAARGLLVDGADRLPDAAALALASRIEGHPDNVAACLLGGLTVAWTDAGAGRAIRVAGLAPIRPVALVAPTPSSTHHVRGLLPPTVHHGEAAFAAGRSALLVAALTGAPEALFAGTEDSLHQRHRAVAMPATAELVQRLRAGGLAAVVSGAGPTVLVLARGEAEVEQVLALTVPDGWIRLPLAVDDTGAEVGNTRKILGVAADGVSV